MADARAERTTPSGTEVPAFGVARRGYDRAEVDAHLEALTTQLGEARQAWQVERSRAERMERQLREADRPVAHRRTEAPDPETQSGFGYRLEKLLRAAEQEAEQVRSSAGREATALVERARVDAETHRHQMEQSLIARTATLEQEAARRQVELDERERQISQDAVVARDEAEAMLAEARRESEQVRQEAVARIEVDRRAAEQAAGDRQERAEAELSRLHGLHEDVLGKLERLLTVLATEFNGPSEVAPGTRTAQRQPPPPPGHPGQRGTERDSIATPRPPPDAD